MAYSTSSPGYRTIWERPFDFSKIVLRPGEEVRVLAEEETMADQDQERGIYEKYIVKRGDGRSEPGQRHYGCNYFVLDLTHDRFARKALLQYAEDCKVLFPELSKDLYRIADQMIDTQGPD